MIVNGIDLSKLDNDQFGGFVPGRTLITDGDGPAYVAAATVKTLPTAIKRFQSAILQQMFIAGAATARIHLTAMDSHKAGRFNINAAKPYQGQRKSKDKPALLEPLREAMADPSNWLPEFQEVILHRLLEADDGMIQDAYVLKDSGVIRSDDKDLRMTPYPYWEIKLAKLIKDHGFGSLHLEYTGSGTPKCLGYGKKFFWAQMIMGDTADHIAGLTRYDGQLCGPVCAYQKLDPINDENEVANFVIDAYRRNKQNPIPEGWLLWLLRHPGDTFWTYLGELDISPVNRAFLDEQVRLPWFIQPQAAQTATTESEDDN